MSDDLRMKIAELEKKLGGEPGGLADAKEGAPTPTAAEMIDQMIKKMRGEIEPAKVIKEEKPVRLMPTEHVTFPQFIGALTAEMGAGFMKGLLHPVSSFTNNIGLKFTPGDVERQKVIRNYMRRGDFPIKSSLGLEAIAEKAPGAVGEVAGTIATFMPVYRGTSIAVRGVGTAIDATESFVRMSKAARETVRIAATNLGSTTLFEAAAELDDGESKLARVAMDSAFGIALEGAGPISRLLRAGLQEELGEAGFKALADQVGEQTLIRTRAGVATPEEAERVLKAAKRAERKQTSKKDARKARRRERYRQERKASQESNVRATKKRVADTPVVAQARKIQEAAFEKLLPPPNGMILDPGLALAVAKGERPGVHYKVSVDGQIIEGVFHTSSREYPNRFAQNVIDVRNRIIALQKEGKDARLIEVRFGSPGSRSRFENLWLGKVSENRVHGRPAPKIPHSVTDNKSAAVRGVQVGQKVKVKRPDGKTVDAEVVKTDFVPVGKNPYAGSGFDPSLPVQKDGTPTASIMREDIPQKREYSERYTAEDAKTRLNRIQRLRKKIKTLPKNKELAERLLRTWYNEAVTDAERKLIEDALQPLKSQEWREWLRGVQEKGKAAAEAARAERNALREKLGSSAVTVKYPDGKIEVLDLKEIEVAVPRMREPLELQQHVSGAEQRLYIDTVNRKVEWEGIASNLDPESNFFRSGFFEEVDPTIDYHDHVRGAYKDGVLTLSAPAAYEEMIPTQTGPMIRQSIPDEGANVSMHYRDNRPGPYLGGVPRGTDIAETIMGRAAPEYATTYRHGYAQEDKSKPIRDAARMNVEPQEGRPWYHTVELQADGTYMALGIPRHQRGHVPAGWEPPGLDEARTLRRSKLIAERDDSLDDVEGVLDDLDDFDAVSDDETADEIFSANTRRRLAQRGVDPLELRYEDATEAGEYVEYSGFIRRDDLPNNPAAVPLKRAARTLLEQGVPGDTKVALHVTNTRYQVQGGEPIMTLEELADLELAIPSWERLKSEADVRGLKVLPVGAGAEVTTAEGLKYHFHDQLEALYAITKYPINRLGVKLDSDIEKVFGMGSERLYDADVDIDSFRPAKLQELATQSLFTGQRPAISVWSRNPFKVEAAIRVMEKNAGLKEGTFKVLTVSADESKRKMTLIYEPNRVRQTLLPFQQSGFLKNMLGVDWNVSDELLLQQLADIPHGLDVLYGREPFSAMFYAYLRKKGLKEEWKRGVLQNDELGPYRTFPREVAGPSTVGVRGGAPDIPDATGDDLGDLVGLPEGMGTALSGEVKPTVPDIEPEKLAEFEEYMRRLDRGESPIKDTGGGIFSKLYAYFAVPLKHWQKRQAETGVPFFDWYEAISFARQDVEVMLNDTIHQTRLIEKNYDRKTRELAQQLFEAKMAGVDYDRFYSRVEEPVRKAAEDIEASLRNFFIDKMSWDEKMFRQFWGTEVSNIRKADGDASYYFRRHLPGPSRTIFKQLESGEVMFDQREFDPAKIIKRVTRAFANEQHLVPVVNKVRKQIVPFVQAGRIPAGDGAMFEKYLNEAVHMPDYLQMQLSYGIKKTIDAIVKRFPGAKRALTEAESVDVMGAFSSFNVLANMGFQPGMIMRNFIGGAQMIYSTAGSADAATRALSWAAKAMRNPKAKKWLEDRGVIMRDPVAQSVANIADATRTLAGGRALGAIGTGYTKVLETGMSAYKTTDDFTRVWAYKTQYDISKSLGKKLAEKKITIDEYVDQGKIDMLGPIVERNTRTMLLQGKYEEAAHYTALYYKDMTQFRYGRGDVPYVLQGTVGRLFGQYGTWPLNYIQFLKDSVMGPGSRKNRLGVVAKWAAVQGATFLTMQEVFGVDFTRWSFFAPVGYRGGPFLELADQASSVLKAKVAGDDDVVAKLQAQRLKDHAYKQLTPVPWGALRTLDKTMEEMQSGDWPSTLRALLGLPEATP